MEFNWTTLAWIAGLVFVYLFGLFEGRGQGYKRRKAEEEQEKKGAPTQTPPPLQTVKVDDPGLLRIKNENGSLTLDLDGRRVDTRSLSSDQRKRLIEMLNLMRPWLEGKPAPASATPPSRFEDSLRKPLPSKPPVSSQTAPASFVPPAESKTPSMSKEDRPVAPANSIVGQIDAILQMRLEGTPLEERGIFLAQSPEGGVMVYVGLTKYMGVEDVPDPEIKAAIRAAIGEWENKYTPGL
jgi:hypothetical protein